MDQSSQISYLKQASQDKLISYILLQNVGVNCEKIIAQKVQSICKNKNASPKKEKPLIDSILEDISLERLKK